MPREWSDGAKCDALRVSDVLVDDKSNSIRGGLGSNVYPTVAEGAFAMTNQIVSAVSQISSGKALVVPLRFEEKNRYCEMVFTWKPSPDCAEDRELVVRGYVNGKRQMAVCCCLHTKGDGINNVQKWLGHSDIGTTANIYAHLDFQSKVESAEKMSSILPIPDEISQSDW